MMSRAFYSGHKRKVQSISRQLYGQARNWLGTPGLAKSFLRETHIF